ncbi:alpha-mannosidase [Paenibacillus cellulositrophicus]|uniref:alpha-mannosidase n=1 Tax=Paenibacillus cellulositrophicus TaxID=562959 RepID=UPI00203E5B5A|nr:alpha-mannosidase [Paenibacillus cellulositrophicus]MCM3001113.1 alpha-mannosidase [Paenibacillus cellulositrophicus]
MSNKPKRTAHIISHTHWDREWYLPYEKHHVRLIRLMDVLMDTLENDTEYKSFYLDGQTIILEDYLQVRPEQKERLEKYIREGRIFIGPWYILQDAFLTSGEANIRNMQIGHKDARRYGQISKVGYFPDTFGIVGQAPQLMRQSGIDNALFGRGVKPTGFNNTVADSEYESSFSELIWEGPDGSKVLGILFANWYSNGNEIPADPEEAKAFWDRKLADAEKYASTPELLFMNGCDHQPIQTDLAEALETARKLYPDTEFVHSNFPQYLESVKGHQENELSVVRGELRSQRTDGWGTLVNTASARVYLKQMNQHGQALLEKVAEPLAAYAHLTGQAYPHHLFTYAWKTLMQNHPHDSICGCSVDEVHREMVTRFAKSRDVAESIIEDSKRAVADAVDTSSFAQYGEDALPFVVFNTTGWERTGTVSVELDVQRIYFRDGIPLDEISRRIQALELGERVVLDPSGKPVPFTLEDLGQRFGYDLPDDRFRQPYMARAVRITLQADAVPAHGLRAYALVSGQAATQQSDNASASLITGSNVMENSILRVVAQPNGSLTVTDKRNGREYRDLLVYEDTGDIGNEYMYKQPEGEAPLTTRDLQASIRVVEDTPYRATLEIVHDWEVPASADELLQKEQIEVVYYPERKAQRVKETVPMKIRTLVRLEKDGKGVKVEASFNNQAKDHRVRALFPTDIEASRHRVDSMFEIVTRDNQPAIEWQNPSNAQHQQAFVDVSGETAGLAVANLGLNEYEVLRDGRNTIAVTLLRSVGELGDWGWFPTPEAQCLGEHAVQLEIIPHDGSGEESGAYAEAYQFQIPWTSVQTGIHTGDLSAVHAPFAWSGEGVAFSAWTVNEDSGDHMLRWYNMKQQPASLRLEWPQSVSRAYKTTILEETEGASVEQLSESLELEAGPCEIVTIGIER